MTLDEVYPADTYKYKCEKTTHFVYELSDFNDSDNYATKAL